MLGWIFDFSQSLADCINGKYSIWPVERRLSVMYRQRTFIERTSDEGNIS